MCPLTVAVQIIGDSILAGQIADNLLGAVVVVGERVLLFVGQIIAHGAVS